MNRYGEQAMDHYRRHRPRALAQIEDPSAYFDQVGRDLEEAIRVREQELAGASVPGEGYLERLKRLNGAKSAAESAVLREDLLLEVEEDEQE